MKLDKDINLISDDAHIDLTPLIDVIFMLLIFFILTMSFSQTALKITLPQSKYSEKIRENNLISITVTTEGKYLIKKDEVTLDNIALKLDENKDAQLNIAADANCPFQAFLDLVDLAKNKRQGKFILATNNKDSGNKSSENAESSGNSSAIRSAPKASVPNTLAPITKD